MNCRSSGMWCRAIWRSSARARSVPSLSILLAQQIPYYRQRLAVKPGITGWAQINHKYGDTELDAMIKLEYDLYYIKNVAPALDFYIIFHTVKVMLLSRGAQ